MRKGGYLYKSNATVEMISPNEEVRDLVRGQRAQMRR